MAHIEKRNRGGKTSWRARYRAPDGGERSRSFATKSDAEQWLDTVRGDLARGTYVDPAGGKKRFGEYAREWQATRVHRPSTEVQVESHLRLHVLPRFEDRPLGSIRRSEIQAFVKGALDEDTAVEVPVHDLDRRVDFQVGGRRSAHRRQPMRSHLAPEDRTQARYPAGDRAGARARRRPP